MQKIKKAILVSETSSLGNEMPLMFKQSWGIEISGMAGSIKQAISKLDSLNVQMILLDTDLSDFNQANLLNLINIPIVLLVNSHNEIRNRKYKAILTEGYIVKPLDLAAIQNIMKQEILGSGKKKKMTEFASLQGRFPFTAGETGKAPQQGNNYSKPGQRSSSLQQSEEKRGRSSLS